jgi:origin recognition complex subunit 4
MLQSLTSTERTKIPVIIILEEFHHFTTHALQALLYNLFDLVQNSKSPVTVIGLTNHIDCVDSLEKRVKSRFSQIQILFSPPCNFQSFWDMAMEVLTISEVDGFDETTVTHYHAYLELFFEDSTVYAFLQTQYDFNRNMNSFLTISVTLSIS